MAVQFKKAGFPDKIPIDMTPMIDIVFQLLTFFCMTLRVSAAEGDFNIKMPLAAPQAGLPDPNQLPPIKVRMRADAERQPDRSVAQRPLVQRPRSLALTITSRR